MKIFSLMFDSWYILTVSFNWVLLLSLVIFSVAVSYFFPRIFKRKKYVIKEFQLSLGSNVSFTICCDKKTQEIAYKIWVELITRKIGVEVDEYDTIDEIYNSWYCAFGVIRNLLKDIPVECLNASSDLIELATQVLNQGLRPHLTHWQAKYRAWLSSKKECDIIETPQEIQKQYPEYDELIQDMQKTSKLMVKFTDMMREIAYQ